METQNAHQKNTHSSQHVNTACSHDDNDAIKTTQYSHADASKIKNNTCNMNTYDNETLQTYAKQVIELLHNHNQFNDNHDALMQALMKTINIIGYNNLVELISEYNYLQAPMSLLSDDKIIKWAEMNHDVLTDDEHEAKSEHHVDDSNDLINTNDNSHDYSKQYTVNQNDYKYADDYVNMNDAVCFTENTSRLIKSLLLHDYVNDYMIMYTDELFDYHNVLSVAVYDSDDTTGVDTNWVKLTEFNEYADRREWPWPLISEFIADNHNDHAMQSFLNTFDFHVNKNRTISNTPVNSVGSSSIRKNKNSNNNQAYYDLINESEHESMIALITYLANGNYDDLQTWIELMEAYENNTNSRIKVIMDMIQSKCRLRYSYHDLKNKVISHNGIKTGNDEYIKPLGSELTDGLINVNEIAYNADRDYSDADFNQIKQLMSEYDDFYNDFLCNRNKNDSIMHAIISNPILIDFIELDNHLFVYISANNILYVTDDNGIKHAIGKGDNGNPDFHDYSGLDDSYNDAYAINHDNYHDVMNHAISSMFANMKEGYPMEYIIQDAYNVINAYMNNVINS